VDDRKTRQDYSGAKFSSAATKWGESPSAGIISGRERFLKGSPRHLNPGNFKGDTILSVAVGNCDMAYCKRNSPNLCALLGVLHAAKTMTKLPIVGVLYRQHPQSADLAGCEPAK